LEDAQIELTVKIKGTCEGLGRAPLHVINPAAVRSPRRRQRLLKLQPLLVIHGKTNQKAATERANIMTMLSQRVGERNAYYPAQVITHLNVLPSVILFHVPVLRLPLPKKIHGLDHHSRFD